MSRTARWQLYILIATTSFVIGYWVAQLQGSAN